VKEMKKKIMIVDDEADQIYTIKLVLQNYSDNYEVIGATSGEQCLDLLKNNQIPDLILLDIMMPEMNGWDVAAEIKKNSNWNKIPLVFLTAKTDTYSKTFGGIVSQEYITKPFEKKKLIECINKYLND
jgi:CheY-like chemotaxis protein